MRRQRLVLQLGGRPCSEPSRRNSICLLVDRSSTAWSICQKGLLPRASALVLLRAWELFCATAGYKVHIHAWPPGRGKQGHGKEHNEDDYYHDDNDIT
jgi:hypothetical protein